MRATPKNTVRVGTSHVSQHSLLHVTQVAEAPALHFHPRQKLCSWNRLLHAGEALKGCPGTHRSLVTGPLNACDMRATGASPALHWNRLLHAGEVAWPCQDDFQSLPDMQQSVPVGNIPPGMGMQGSWLWDYVTCMKKSCHKWPVPTKTSLQSLPSMQQDHNAQFLAVTKLSTFFAQRPFQMLTCSLLLSTAMQIIVECICCQLRPAAAAAAQDVSTSAMHQRDALKAGWAPAST